MAIIHRRNGRYPRWPFNLNPNSSLAQGIIAAYAFHDPNAGLRNLVNSQPMTKVGTSTWTSQSSNVAFRGSAYYIPFGSGNYLDSNVYLLNGLSNYSIFTDSYFNSTVNAFESSYYAGQGTFGSSSHNGGLYLSSTEKPVFYTDGTNFIQGSTNDWTQVDLWHVVGSYASGITNGTQLIAKGERYGVVTDIVDTKTGTPGSDITYRLSSGFGANSSQAMWWRGNLVWNRALTRTEFLQLMEPDWADKIYVETGRSSWFFFPVSTGSTGTAAVTEGADTSAATGTVVTAITGTAAATEGADTSTATGTVLTAITGTAAVTEGADTAVATGLSYTAITGTSAVTEGADTSAASGIVSSVGSVVGTGAATEGADTAVATGTVVIAITATGAITEGADTAVATGTVVTAITGTVAATEGADTAAAAGTVLAPGAITGTAAVTEGADIVFAVGFVPLTGLDTPSEQVLRIIRASFLRDTLTHVQQGSTIGTFEGLFLHSRPEEYPVVYAPRDDVVARGVVRGDILQANGFTDYVVEGVRSDGAYILTMELRMHIEAG